MADKRLSELPAASTITGTEQVLISQSGQSKRASVGLLASGGTAGAGSTVLSYDAGSTGYTLTAAQSGILLVMQGASNVARDVTLPATPAGTADLTYSIRRDQIAGCTIKRSDGQPVAIVREGQIVQVRYVPPLGNWLVLFDSVYRSYPLTFGGAATLTLEQSDNLLICGSGAGAYTLTLPAASGATGYGTYTFKRSGINNVTIAAAGSDTIDGAATYVLSANYASVTLQAYGNAWYIVAKV